MRSYTAAHKHANSRAQTRVRVHTHSQEYTRSQINTHTHIHTYTSTETHARARARAHTHTHQLPCGHKFCKKCIEEWQKKGMDNSCPLCRNPLPPGPAKLFDLGVLEYMKIRGAIDRSRPGVDEQTPWPALSGNQQRVMDQAVTMLREAADQGHKLAQALYGEVYAFGQGVPKDDRLAFVYHERAAQQGHAVCQYNTGLYYLDGCGCEQNDGRSAKWFKKAARHGHTDAMYNLGILYELVSSCLNIMRRLAALDTVCIELFSNKHTDCSS